MWYLNIVLGTRRFQLENMDLPCGSVKLGSKLISHGVVRSNGTLRDSWNTVHLIHSRLKEAMPVERRSFVVELVGDFDPDHVSVVGFDKWPWELPIDADSLLGLNTVRSDIALRDSEVVGPSSSSQRAGLVRVGVGCCNATPRSLTATTVVLWQSLHLSSAVFGRTVLLVGGKPPEPVLDPELVGVVGLLPVHLLITLPMKPLVQISARRPSLVSEA